MQERDATTGGPGPHWPAMRERDATWPSESEPQTQEELMVQARKPTQSELIDRLAQQAMYGTPELVSAPFVPLPPGIETIDDLMAFDKAQCARYRQFRRPLCPADFIDPKFAKRAGVNKDARGVVLVTQIAPGVRWRNITEYPRAG